jgi:hypothetical protein
MKTVQFGLEKIFWTHSVEHLVMIFCRGTDCTEAIIVVYLSLSRLKDSILISPRPLRFKYFPLHPVFYIPPSDIVPM